MSTPAVRLALYALVQKLGADPIGAALLAKPCSEVVTLATPVSRSGVDLLRSVMFILPRVKREPEPRLVDVLSGLLFPGSGVGGLPAVVRGFDELLTLLLDALRSAHPELPTWPTPPDGPGKKTGAGAFADWCASVGLDGDDAAALGDVRALYTTAPRRAVSWVDAFSGELKVADQQLDKRLTKESVGIFVVLHALAARGQQAPIPLTPPAPLGSDHDRAGAVERVPPRLQTLARDIVRQMAMIEADDPAWELDLDGYRVRTEWMAKGELRLIFNAKRHRSFGHVVAFTPSATELRVTWLRGSRVPGAEEPPWQAMARAGLGIYLDELCDPLSELRATVLDRVGYAKWEKLADALKRQAAVAGQDTPTEERDQRILWVLDPRDDRPPDGMHVTFDLAPYLTRRKKTGGWTRPQRKSYRQALVLGAGVLGAVDREVLEHLTEDHSAFGQRRLSIDGALKALRMLRDGGIDVLCRLTQTEEGVTLLLEEHVAAVRLDADDDDDGFTVALHADGHPLDREDAAFSSALLIDATHEDPPRMLAVTVPTAVQKVARTLSDLDLDHVPAEGASTVAEALVQLTPQKVNVELPPSLSGRELAADTTVVVRAARLSPLGLVLRLGHQPLPGGAFVHPAEGASTLMGEVGGERVQTTRDLDAERERLRVVTEALELSVDDAVGPWRYRFDDGDVALEVLAHLHDLALPAGADETPMLRVQWADTGALRTVTVDSASQLQVRVEQPRDWFVADGALEVDGHKVALIKLLRQSREGKRWIQVDRDLFLKLDGQLRQQLQDLAALAHERRGQLELGPHVAPLLDALEDAGAQLQDTEARRALRARIAQAGDPELRLPPAVARVLRPYQKEGARWMLRLAHWGVGGCLADDMGLGKTLQTLAVLEARKSGGAQLVVAPTSVCANWKRECERFTPGLTPLLYEGAKREDLLEDLGPGDVLIASYALLALDERLREVGFHSAIYDEAQYLKNHATKRSQAARALDADWSMALTGTPVENHLGELWSIFHAVSPALLGSHKRFMLSFATPIEKHKDAGRRRLLQRTLRPFLLRRLKGEVEAELPKRTDVIVPIVLSADERAIYEAVRQEILERLHAPRIEDHDRRMEVLAGLTRLRQIACHPQLEDGESTVASSKLAQVASMLEQLRAGGHRALVFSQFVRHLEKVEALLRSQQVGSEDDPTFFKLIGATPAGRRRELIDRFQQGEADVFLISLKAGGTGLNLTAASYVLHLDPWWNPAVEDQATDRAHRIGQDKPVTVFRFISQGTVEEQILQLHEDKRALAEELVSGGTSKLSTEALVELLRRH
jgi:superfamily II DNA or RNA helicase